MRTKRKKAPVTPPAPPPPPEPMTPEKALLTAWRVCLMHEEEVRRQMSNRCDSTKATMNEIQAYLQRESPVFNSLGLLQCIGELDHMAGRLKQIGQQKGSLRSLAEVMGVTLDGEEDGNGR